MARPQPFSERGEVAAVFGLANAALLAAWPDGYLPEHIALDVNHQDFTVRLTFSWKLKKPLEKKVRFETAASSSAYQAKGVFTGSRWSHAFSFGAAEFYVGLRNA